MRRIPSVRTSEKVREFAVVGAARVDTRRAVGRSRVDAEPNWERERSYQRDDELATRCLGSLTTPGVNTTRGWRAETRSGSGRAYVEIKRYDLAAKDLCRYGLAIRHAVDAWFDVRLRHRLND